MSFNIETLLSVNFPDALCPKCAALICTHTMCPENVYTSRCPGCQAKWRIGREDAWKDFFRATKSQIKMIDGLAHAHEMAGIVQAYQAGKITPMQLLFQLLAASKYFVHFATYNFGADMLGVFAAVSSRIPVRGVIGEQLNKPNDSYKIDAMNAFKNCEENLELTLTGSNPSVTQTHTKLYIFDGIVALHGSMNLTLNGWTKARENSELLEIKSEIDHVRDLNNKYISRYFRRRGQEQQTEYSIADDYYNVINMVS